MSDSDAPRPLEQRHPQIGEVLRRFQTTLDVLLEMLEETGPQLHEYDLKRLSPEAISALRSLPPEKQQELRQVLEEEERRLEELIDEAPERDETPKDGTYDGGDEEALSSGATNGNGAGPGAETAPDPDAEAGARDRHADARDQIAEEISKRMKEIFGDDPYPAVSFARTLLRKVQSPSRLAIFYDSILAMAISAFEVLIAGLVVRCYIAHPDALDTEEKQFSLQDLRRYDDVDDAVDDLMSRRVADLTYKGFDDWAKWFKDRCNADFRDYAIDYKSVHEAFQRRHCVIHNGGLASRQYVAAVEVEGPQPEVGKRLVITEDYLRNAIDELEALGTGLAIAAWGTWMPAERERSCGALLHRVYELLLDERWPVVAALTKQHDRLKASDGLRYSLKCNHWLARLELHGPDDVRAEVDAWDTSALAGRFRLVRLTLLGEVESALDIVPHLVETQQLRKGELLEWPILSRLRAHERFPDVLGKL